MLNCSGAYDGPCYARLVQHPSDGQLGCGQTQCFGSLSQLNRDRDPLLYDYLQMVLSPAGQAIIAAGERGYLPLNAADLAAERLKAFGRKGPQP